MIEAAMIVLEDTWLVVINKPSAMNTEPNTAGHPNAMDMLQAFLQERGSLPSNFKLGLPHRLDRLTSGVQLFTTRQQALAQIGRQFENREVDKTYWALVEGDPGEGGTLAQWHHRMEGGYQAVITHKKVPGAKEAILRWKLLQTKNGRSLCEVQPQTCRFHQIRAQFAAAGHPVVNDTRYGATSVSDETIIWLHALQLDFKHPKDGIPLSVRATVPANTIWTGWEKAM